MVSQAAFRLLLHDSGAFMARLEQVKPFALHMPMVAAASPSVAARRAIERYFEAGRGELQGILAEFRNWLSGPDGRAAADVEAQRRFAVLRLRFQRLLTQFDLFADTLTQRSEHDFGVWLAGLDMLAHDSLALPGAPYEVPPLLCYLDRGIGAAIRRARTRLPGGGDNPVAIIRVPRERMIGTGVAGSLLHETGHQGAALLGLVDSLRSELRAMRRCDGSLCPTRMLWERWLSEIIADLWSVAMLGIGATYGMINVVALPRAFIFRMKMDDPHPPPWLRVRLSAAMGKALYPDPQWSQLIALWSRLYPPDRIEGQKGRLFQAVEASIPHFVSVLLAHRPPSLGGAALPSLFPLAERTPRRLRMLSRGTVPKVERLAHLAPSLALATLGQARADGMLGPAQETSVIKQLLTVWATRREVAPVRRRLREDVEQWEMNRK